MKKARNFCLTQNDMDKLGDTLNYLRSLKCNYLLAGREIAPTTGHVHAQMYVQFVTPHVLSIKKLCGAHVEISRGSPERNIEYCKKDNDIIVEEGTPRLCNSHSIKAVMEMPKEERNQLNVNLYNIVNKINMEENKYIDPKTYYKKVDVYFVYGPSGIGKTKWCIEHMTGPFNEVKFDGHFWHGVTEDCPIALYDDWRDNHMKPAEFINFIDYTRHVMNIKGSTIRNNYETIYITSIQDPTQIYPKSKEQSTQWIRRIHCINLNPELGGAGGVSPLLWDWSVWGKCGK